MCPHVLSYDNGKVQVLAENSPIPERRDFPKRGRVVIGQQPGGAFSEISEMQLQGRNLRPLCPPLPSRCNVFNFAMAISTIWFDEVGD
jgi:hypothetical protein